MLEKLKMTYKLIKAAEGNPDKMKQYKNLIIEFKEIRNNIKKEYNLKGRKLDGESIKYLIKNIDLNKFDFDIKPLFVYMEEKYEINKEKFIKGINKILKEKNEIELKRKILLNTFNYVYINQEVKKELTKKEKIKRNNNYTFSLN